MIDYKKKDILKFVKGNPSCSSKEIHEGLSSTISYATVKRALTKLIVDNLIVSKGKGRGRKYVISPAYDLFYPIDVSQYFEQEIDERKIKDSFNFSLVPKVLSKVNLFTEEELKYMSDLQSEFSKNVSELSELEYSKELERLSIDLSWKSSQIEGNTYSLLETERLLKEKETADGKSKDEAVMLLNHKQAIDFVLENPNYLSPLTTSSIEDIHSILVKISELIEILEKEE